MANEKVSIELVIENAGSAKTVGELKKAIKDLKSEALGVREGSKEFIQLTAAAAAAKNKIDDLNQAVNSLNPEGKFAAFAKLGGTIASGFQAAQGAAVLFGGESKELEKQLLKVQAATAFSQGIQGLTDIKKQFELLGNVIRANPILLISTVVIVLGTALFALKEKIGFVGDAFDWIGKKIGLVKDLVLSFTDTIGLTNTAADKEAEELEKRFARLIERGKIIDKNREDAKKYNEEQKKLAEEANKRRLEEFNNDTRLLGIKLDAQKKYNEEVERLRKDKEDKEKAINDSVDKRFADRFALNLERLKKAREKEDDQRKKDLESEISIQNAKLSIAQSSFEGISALGNIFIKDQQKLEKFNKAAALVQIGIDTAKAIASLTSASQANPANAVTGGLAGVAQFASGIAQILVNIAKAKQLLGASGSSSGSIGGGSAGGVSFSQPRSFQTTTRAIPETEINGENQRSHAIKVFVTETDITEKQDRIFKIKKSSILGG